MDFYKRALIPIGLVALACVIGLLVSSPSFIFSQGVFFIDTGLDHHSHDQPFVKTKLDFGSNEHMKAFPNKIGGWEGYDYETSKLQERLGADVVLQRAYHHPNHYLPIHFLILQSTEVSSFHPPPACLSAQGYQIDEEGTEEIVVTNASWVGDEYSPDNIEIPLKKLIAFKEVDGKITRREVILYFYVRGNDFTCDTFSMIQVSTGAPINSSYDGVLNLEKDYVTQAIPYMFEFTDEREGQTVAAWLAERGGMGFFTIAILLCIPVGIILYPIIRRTPSSDKGSESGR